MDDLRSNVQHARFEQKDPLLIYKFESYELFKHMVQKMNQDVASFLLKCQLPSQPDQVRRAPGARPTQQPRVQTSKQGVQNLNEQRMAAARAQAGAAAAGGGVAGAPGVPPPPPKAEPVRVEKKTLPNEPCPCGSGKKYKKCHGILWADLPLFRGVSGGIHQGDQVDGAVPCGAQGGPRSLHGGARGDDVIEEDQAVQVVRIQRAVRVESVSIREGMKALSSRQAGQGPSMLGPDQRGGDVHAQHIAPTFCEQRALVVASPPLLPPVQGNGDHSPTLLLGPPCAGRLLGHRLPQGVSELRAPSVFQPVDGLPFHPFRPGRHPRPSPQRPQPATKAVQVHPALAPQGEGAGSAPLALLPFEYGIAARAAEGEHGRGHGVQQSGGHWEEHRANQGCS